MDAPEDFIEPPPKDEMSYAEFLSLLSSFANAGWKINEVGAIRTLKSAMSPFNIIGTTMIDNPDIAEHDYLVAEALNLSKADAERIVKAIDGAPGYDFETRHDLLRAVGLLGKKKKKSGA